MRALLDVNVLVALLDSEHAMYSRAVAWYSEHAALGWASCPITQNGCVRVMSQPTYPQRVSVKAVAERLQEAISTSDHAFWHDDISTLETEWVDSSRVLGPRQLTDVYLLALATKNDGRLVTFDRSITLAAVPKAEARHLQVL